MSKHFIQGNESMINQMGDLGSHTLQCQYSTVLTYGFIV